VVSWTTSTVRCSKHCRPCHGEPLVHGGGPHPRVSQEAINPFGLSPAARSLRDGIVGPLRERFQDAGQAGLESFVRQNRSRRHLRGPDVCVCIARPREVSKHVVSYSFLIIHYLPLGPLSQLTELWVMVRRQGG